MDKFTDKKEGFIWGMRIIFWWVIFALFFMICSFIIVYQKYKSKDTNEENELMKDEMGENMSEFMKLEIRRRLAQSTF